MIYVFPAQYYNDFRLTHLLHLRRHTHCTCSNPSSTETIMTIHPTFKISPQLPNNFPGFRCNSVFTLKMPLPYKSQNIFHSPLTRKKEISLHTIPYSHVIPALYLHISVHKGSGLPSNLISKNTNHFLVDH